MLMALDYMHRVCNMIHTDLKPENIMLELKGKQFEECIADLKTYKKKPLSMKFLKKFQSVNSEKNKKKRDKKKKKKLEQQQKKAAEEAAAKLATTTEENSTNPSEARTAATENTNNQDGESII